MKSIKLFSAVIIILLIHLTGTVSFAQGTVNLSGTYVLNEAKSPMP